eukprot:m.132386 g.132386  ORF g.132386 m.132386 type:complete len:492 (+) comp22444_c0_seq3:90-1565(+)
MVDTAVLIRGIEGHGVAGASALARWQYACTPAVPHFPGVSEAAAAACLQLVYAAFVSSGDGAGDADDGSTAKACALNVGAAGGDPSALTPALFAAAAVAAGLAAEAVDTTAAGLTTMGLLSGVKAGRILIVPYLSGVDPSHPLCDGTGTLSFAIIVGCVVKVSIGGGASPDAAAHVGNTAVKERPQVGSLKQGALAFLNQSSSGGDGSPSTESAHAGVGRLRIDTTFLDSSPESTPPIADRRLSQVGKLKGAHSFLEDSGGPTPGRSKDSSPIGKLAKDMSFLDSAAASPDGVERPVRHVGKLDVNVHGPQTAVDEAPRPPASKLDVDAAFANDVAAPSDAGGLTMCHVCDKKVFPMEKVSIDGDTYHKWCLRCSECNKVLSAGSYAKVHGVLFCKPHFQQLFKSKGNYDEGFGHNSRKRDFIQGDAASDRSLLPHEDSQLEDDGAHMLLVVRHAASAELLFIPMDLLLRSNQQCGNGFGGHAIRITGLVQ